MKKLLLYLFLWFGIPTVGFCQDALNTKITKINFDNIPLVDCFSFIQDVSDKNIIIDWHNIIAAGVFKDENIDLHLKNVTLKQTLNLLLEQASDTTPLIYYEDNGVIRVTTKDIAYSHTVTRVYNVQDLLATIPNFTIQNNPEPPQPQQPSQPTSSLPSQIPLPNTPTSTPKPDTQVKSLITLIESSVEPTIWLDNGGTVGYIGSFNGLLIVTAPEAVQEQIVGK